MGKTFVCGDIHGANKALIQCLERANFNKEVDTLIQLGDVADGWAEVYECVETLLSIPNLIAIRGNHDFWTLQWMLSGTMEYNHHGQGGKATKDSYIRNGVNDFYQDKLEHLNFFKYQHDHYVDEQNRLFVHGGINRDIPLSEGNNAHNFSWNRTMWFKALSCKGEDKLNFVEKFTKVFIGHTTTLNWDTDKPMYGGGVWNLDTGAGFEGRLTIMDVDTEAYWQSDLVQDLYPEESGRNKIKGSQHGKTEET